MPSIKDIGNSMSASTSESTITALSKVIGLAVTSINTNKFLLS
jgi:hypothetical protein